MSDKDQQSSFPSNRIEALTMLYLEFHATEVSTPEELAMLYLDVYATIKEALRSAKRQPLV